MRKYALLAAAAGMALSGSFAQAGFTFSSVRQNGAGPNGTDLVSFYALNDGNGTGTKAIAADITEIAYSDGGGTAAPGSGLLTVSTKGTKADLTGANSFDPNDNTFKPAGSFVNILTENRDPNNDDTTQFNVVQATPAATATNYKNGVGQFEVVGANLAGGVASNSGKGALVAVAAVTAGQAVGITGSVGGDVGTAFALPSTPTFSGTGANGAELGTLNVVPEPASLGLLSLGLGGLMIRRRRA